MSWIEAGQVNIQGAEQSGKERLVIIEANNNRIHLLLCSELGGEAGGWDFTASVHQTPPHPQVYEHRIAQLSSILAKMEPVDTSGQLEDLQEYCTVIRKLQETRELIQVADWRSLGVGYEYLGAATVYI